jgi:adenylosuccinate synthase
MPRFMIVISGPVVSGKTTLALRLREALKGGLLRTRPVLEQLYHVHPKPNARDRLQILGERLDRETGGRWVAEAASREGMYLPRRTPLIVTRSGRRPRLPEFPR